MYIFKFKFSFYFFYALQMLSPSLFISHILALFLSFFLSLSLSAYLSLSSLTLILPISVTFDSRASVCHICTQFTLPFAQFHNCWQQDERITAVVGLICIGKQSKQQQQQSEHTT